MALRESLRLCRMRRDPDLRGWSGAQSVAKLLKMDSYSRYGAENTSAMKHATLVAADVDEPADDTVVPMLQYLSPEEALYYGSGANVISTVGKSDAIFTELEEHFGFVGGPVHEYADYFRRTNMSSTLWTFGLAADIKAVGGFGVVPQKSGKLRKVFMSCATNYIMDDVWRRE